jgi:serine/threonine-protein kinase
MTSIEPDRINAALDGRYTIEREAGSGGMATVFLAHDIRHDRKVALKVLKPELAAVMGGERFLTEIRTTASLQHPHILALFDSGEADGFLFFVMPFVRGETLRDLIDREKQLPVDQAVAIGAKVAQALDYAHRHGVVHRDIKPANILLHDGEPVVADFGIALAVQEAGGGRLTETGLSLGTPFYMSPEQATGDRVPDARSDVYSLGSVLYEMLTGEPPFQGTTAQSVLGRILTSEVVPPTEARKSLPRHVGAVVMKALERLPADRFESAGEMASALGDTTFRHGAEAGTEGPGVASGFWRPLALASTALTLGLLAYTAFFDGGGGATLETLRLSVPIPDEAPLLTPDAGASIQISEDGSTIAYLGLSGQERQIFVRARGDLEPRPVPNTSDTRFFFLSPSGREVAFLSGTDQTLRAVLTESGVVRSLADSAAEFSGDWTSDGWIYFQNLRNGISRIQEVGGTPEALTDLTSAVGAHTWIDVLPGGEKALMSVWGATAASDSVAVIDLGTREITNLAQGVLARYLPPGYLIYGTARGQLMAAPFDADAGVVTGPTLPVVEGIRSGGSGESEFSLSWTGSVVYRASSGGGLGRLVWVSDSGASEIIDSLFVGDLSTPALSPDQRQVAFVQTSNGRPDIWTKRIDISGGPPQRITFEGEGDDIRRPAWSSDGTEIFFISSEGRTSRLQARRADGTGAVRTLLGSDSSVINEVSPSPTGGWLVLRIGANPASRDLFAYRYDGVSLDTVAVPIAASSFDERAPAVSPSGRFIAFLSNRSGRTDIYVRPFPDSDRGVWRITSAGATEPRWGSDDSELFYRSTTRHLIRVELELSDGVRTVTSEELFDVSNLAEDNAHWAYDVHPRDGRILAVQREGAEGAPVIWIENFPWELERRFQSVRRR